MLFRQKIPILFLVGITYVNTDFEYFCFLHFELSFEGKNFVAKKNYDLFGGVYVDCRHKTRLNWEATTLKQNTVVNFLTKKCHS